MTNPMPSYRFGTFVLDLDDRRLRQIDGSVVPLSPRLFDALLFFVEHVGELLDKDMLFAALWAGVIVEENSLSQMISALRRALGDDAQHSRYIQTVPRRGFRFTATVIRQDDPEAAVLDPVDAPEAVGPRTTRRAPKTPATDVSRSRRLMIGGSVAAVVAGGGAAAWWASTRAPSATAPVTLAVLPFRPLVLENRDEALEVGIADSLIARLSMLPAVVVRSIGSSRRYAGAEQDPMRAARELDVGWILDGSLQRWGGQVRVTARLLDARTGEAAWSGSFDEPFTGLFDLQDAIATRAAAVLAPELGARQRDRLAAQQGGTRDIDAYQLYLAARRQAEGIRTAGLTKSIALFHQAIALDARYALAYAGLAESYRRMIFGADGEPRVVFASAREYARRAIAIDAGLAAGFAGEGWNLFWNDWDWVRAENSFRQAILLNPNEVNAHFGYGQLLDMLGRDAEAATQMRIARALDPQSLISLTLESGTLYDAGKTIEGRERLQRVFDLEPDFWVAHLTLASMLMREGRREEAIAEFERADRQSDGSSQPAAALGYVLAKASREREARAILVRFADLATSRYVPPTSFALVHAGLGDREATLGALQRGYAVRDVRMTLLPGDARFGFVRNDPRFVALLARMNLRA